MSNDWSGWDEATDEERQARIMEAIEETAPDLVKFHREAEAAKHDPTYQKPSPAPAPAPEPEPVVTVTESRDELEKAAREAGATPAALPDVVARLEGERLQCVSLTDPTAQYPGAQEYIGWLRAELPDYFAPSKPNGRAHDVDPWET